MATPQNNFDPKTATPKGLEARFHLPENWQWGVIDGGDYQLRYGYASPADNQAKGAVICLPGLSEYCEKFFEIAHEVLAHHYAFFVIDWRGQGLSSRYLANPHKRHSQGMDLDAQDLQRALEACPIIHDDLPLHMLAHSMGGNIGLRFLDQYPTIFSTASFSAPLTGLHVFSAVPRALATAASSFFNRILPRAYAPTGGDWSPTTRDLTSAAVFTQDTHRAAVHNAWMLENPALQVGHITNRWLWDAHQSCLTIQNTIQLEAINIPCLFALAGHEAFVNNTQTRAVAARIPKAKIIELPDARHEILMETDNLRDQFMKKFYSLIN